MVLKFVLVSDILLQFLSNISFPFLCSIKHFSPSFPRSRKLMTVQFNSNPVGFLTNSKRISNRISYNFVEKESKKETDKHFRTCQIPDVVKIFVFGLSRAPFCYLRRGFSTSFPVSCAKFVYRGQRYDTATYNGK